MESCTNAMKMCFRLVGVSQQKEQRMPIELSLKEYPYESTRLAICIAISSDIAT